MPSNDGKGLSRRGFLRGAGTAAVTTGVIGIPVFVHGEEPQAPAAPTDIDKIASTGATISLSINGQAKEFTVSPADTLLQVIREQANLTGAKEVCSRGSCGACTVLVDGKSVNSCLMLAVDAVGHQVTTVEGLVKEGNLDPVQKAFAEHDACQCGYCIPGFVVRSKALLTEVPHPNREQVKEGLCGNICRCAAYVRIFDAVEAAGKENA